MWKPSIQDIRLGAVYRFGARRRLDRAALTALLEIRLGMKAQAAAQLAGHWLTTDLYRNAA